MSGLVVRKLEDLKDREAVTQVIRTTIMSKQYGLEDFLAGLVADACCKKFACHVLFYVKFVVVCHTRILFSLTIIICIYFQ